MGSLLGLGIKVILPCWKMLGSLLCCLSSYGFQCLRVFVHHGVQGVKGVVLPMMSKLQEEEWLRLLLLLMLFL